MTIASERGVALVIALTTMLFVMALGAALVTIVSSEALIAGGYRVGQQALAAAEAAAGLYVAGDAFVDGSPSGARRLADGSAIDLAAVLGAADAEGPSPAPGEWQLVSYGPLDDRLPADDGRSGFYVVVMTTDDPASADPNVVTIRSEAFGPQGAHRVIQLIADRATFPMRVLRWQQSP